MADTTPDQIDREVDDLIDLALDDLFEKIDRVRDKHGLTDAEMLDRLGRYIDSDMADGYAEWTKAGEQA